MNDKKWLATIKELIREKRNSSVQQMEESLQKKKELTINSKRSVK